MLLGEQARGFYLNLPYDGMLAAILPPGAFFGLALLIALRSFLARDRKPKREVVLETFQ